MKPIRNIIFFVTAFLFVYALTPHIDFIPEMITIIMFVISPVLVIYMVYRVLTKGVPSEHTFDEGKWYEDKENVLK